MIDMKLLTLLLLYLLCHVLSAGAQGDDGVACNIHLLDFYYTKSSDIVERCWERNGVAHMASDGQLILATGEQNRTGGMWAKESNSEAILQPNDSWTLKISFLISSNGPVTAAGLAVWLTIRDAILPQRGTRGAHEQNFTGMGIVFETIRIYPGPQNEKVGHPHYRLFAASGINLHNPFVKNSNEAQNRECHEQMFTWAPDRVFYLVLHKIGTEVHAEVNTKDESVDCDMTFSVKPLSDVLDNLPALYLGISAWTGSETPALIILDKLAGEIRVAGDGPFDDSPPMPNEEDTNSGQQGDDFKKSIVIGAVALIGVILTIAIIVFIWICKIDLPCCKKNKNSHQTPPPSRTYSRERVGSHGSHQRQSHHNSRSISEEAGEPLAPIPEYSTKVPSVAIRNLAAASRQARRPPGTRALSLVVTPSHHHPPPPPQHHPIQPNKEDAFYT